MNFLKGISNGQYKRHSKSLQLSNNNDDCYEICEYDLIEKCCDFPEEDCNLVTHESCIEEDTWECNDIEVETCSFFVDTIVEWKTEQNCNVQCVDQPCKEIPMYWCKTCKNDLPNHICQP